MQFHIITDDSALYKEISEILHGQFEDCEVTQLAQTDEIIKAADRGLIELALIDSAFKETDCIAVTNMIRRVSPCSGVIILAENDSLAVKAFEVHAQGCITKPVAADRLKADIDYFCDHFVSAHKSSGRVEVMANGPFELLIDGKPVRFRRRKAKKVLAYLVSQKGRMVTTPELIKVLWGEDCSKLSDQVLLSRNSNLRTIRVEIERVLREAGQSDLFLKNWGEMAVDMDKIKVID